ncbi:MAG: amino acid adenylation domain-containing protein [Myxococcales bacterium]|nr:amino acid adenylation domain-containing protein [Myxococcales bacterium]
MSVAAFLSRLRDRGIELRAEGDKLLVNAPKGAITDDLGDEIRRRKPELLAFLRLGAEAGTARASIAIAKATLTPAAGGAFEAPLSFGQGRLFYLDQLDPGLAVYNVPVAFFVDHALDVTALRSSLADVVARHAVLRTTLRLGPRGPVQHIAPPFVVEIPVVDLSEMARDEMDARCQAVLSEHARAPFDLARGPLIRAVLVRLETTRSVLLVTTHHVVTDGWSQDVFERELAACYEARLRGEEPRLPALELQYADYAVWQTDGRDPEQAKKLDHWLNNLAAPLPVLELPTTEQRGPRAPTEGATARIDVEADVVDRLAALGRRDGATLFMVLVAAYATLLHRVAGQDEVVIGTPIANRNHGQTMELIGYFANTLALRIDLSGAPTFRELVRRVRETCLGAYANQDVPFEQLVDKLGVPRDLSRSPVYQTIFAFEDVLSASPAKPEARAFVVSRRETVHAKVARNDLSAWVSRTDTGLRITFEYPTALFDDAFIERLLASLRVLLGALADGAESPLAELPLLTEEERHRIVTAWNGTDATLPDVSGAHQLYERQADKTPDAIALQFRDQRLTFRELDARANRLARHLANLGAKQGTLVGVFLERSLEMVVTLYAILKAGAAYVPLDPEYPVDRLLLMVSDSELGIVVTSDALAPRVPIPSGGTPPTVVSVDGAAATIGACSAERLLGSLPKGQSTVATDEAAYVIYTSGSTGVPKGVVVPHRALVSFLMSMAKKPGIAPSDTLVAVTTLSFDIAGLELFLPHVVGAKVVVASADVAQNGRKLRDLLESSGATIMQATPATWRALIAAGWRGAKPFKVLCGGEAFPADLLAPLFERASAIWNMYGPTETTIWSTCAPLDASDPRISIGGPIDNTSVYVLDPLGQPTPLGVPGELCIGGLGVSLGYKNRQTLTDARFVPDPFRAASALGPGKMYKTGDVVTQRADGTLLYQRRVDHQVKVRGYRIELGEIESVLAEHEAVDRSVVIVREDRPGDARLVAYLVLKRDQLLTASEVRKHLRKKLPEYMIPQHVVELPALPLTPAGKIARQALPPPDGVAKREDARAPSSPSELSLARIWREVLATESVAATDNFFELGGHSLLSMVVIARVETELGHRLNPRDLLLLTLEQLAKGFGVADGVTDAGSAASSEPKVAPRPPTTPKAEAPRGGLLSQLKGKIFR